MQDMRSRPIQVVSWFGRERKNLCELCALSEAGGEYIAFTKPPSCEWQVALRNGGFLTIPIFWAET
jgi:hypothetical protein